MLLCSGVGYCISSKRLYKKKHLNALTIVFVCKIFAKNKQGGTLNYSGIKGSCFYSIYSHIRSRASSFNLTHRISDISNSISKIEFHLEHRASMSEMEFDV